MDNQMHTLGAAPTSTPEVGPIGRRFVALLVDGLIFTVIQFPLTFAIAFIAGAGAAAGVDGAQMGAMQLVIQGVSWIVSLVLIYFYYGWFYKNKGATPGKLLMGLKVVDATTGAHLTYGKSFLRETVGRAVDSIAILFFFVGILIPCLRKDKRALHDMIANTQVWRFEK